MEGQLNSKTWRSCAFIPNLGIGKGKNGKKKDDPINKQKDLHACMDVALSSFRECPLSVNVVKEVASCGNIQIAMMLLLNPICI
jgi:hypothetical protein